MSTTIGKITRTVWSVYFAPIIMVLLAVVPGLNFLYSLHGGPAWFVLPLAFPVSLFRLYRLIQTVEGDSRYSTRAFAIVSFILYFPIAYIASVACSQSIGSEMGASIAHQHFFALLTFPFGLIFDWDFFAFPK